MYRKSFLALQLLHDLLLLIILTYHNTHLEMTPETAWPRSAAVRPLAPNTYVRSCDNYDLYDYSMNLKHMK